MEFNQLPEFNKDLKSHLKKYRTLNDDLGEIKTILKKRPDERPSFSFRIDHLEIKTCIIKIKKIACKALNPDYALDFIRKEIRQKSCEARKFYSADAALAALRTEN
jgi:hypothetical protein